MNIQSYGPLTELTTMSQWSAEMVKLIKADVAFQILPEDTTFALVAVILERNINDSFWSTTASIGITQPSMSVEVSPDGGIEGRFVGYLVVTPSRMKIYKNMQLYVDEPLTSVTVKMEQSEYVIRTNLKKFKISDALPISDTRGKFESKVSGLNGGLNPLFDKLALGGASVEKVSNQTYLISYIAFALIVAGIIFFIVKH